MDGNITPKSGSWFGAFLFIVAAVIAATLILGFFTKQQLYNSQGQAIGDSRMRGKMPKPTGGRLSSGRQSSMRRAS